MAMPLKLDILNTTYYETVQSIQYFLLKKRHGYCVVPVNVTNFILPNRR